MSKIEQIITEIEEYIDNCKFQPLSNTKIIVVKEEIDELLAELRLKTPDEIKKYQKIISNKEAILNDARERAEAMIAEATAHITELVSEHEIMQQAYQQANDVVQQATNQAQQILDNATEEANSVRMSAMQYTDDALANLQGILTNGMNNLQDKYESLMRSLNTSLEIVIDNRKELSQDDENAEEFDEAGNNLEDYTVDMD